MYVRNSPARYLKLAMSAVRLSHCFRAPFPLARTNCDLIIRKQSTIRSDRPTSINTIGQCMSMNHDKQPRNQSLQCGDGHRSLKRV